MRISEACDSAREASEAVDPWLTTHGPDRLKFRAAMAVLPDEAPASAEFRWIAVHLVLNNRDVAYETAPSKGAAAWIRRMRWKTGKALKDRFWEESWPYYMESRLALELKAGAPLVMKKRGRVVEGDGGAAVQASIDRFKRKKGEAVAAVSSAAGVNGAASHEGS